MLVCRNSFAQVVTASDHPDRSIEHQPPCFLIEIPDGLAVQFFALTEPSSRQFKVALRIQNPLTKSFFHQIVIIRVDVSNPIGPPGSELLLRRGQA